MTSLDKVRASEVWDDRFNLPLIRRHNNPHIYCAFVARLLGPEAVALEGSYETYLAKCEIASGYILRWPDGERSSHDELMGAAYMSPRFAGRALDFLTRTGGHWTLDNPPENRDWIWRFIFLDAYLNAAAGFISGLAAQIKFASHVLWSARKPNAGDCSGALLIWVMMPKVSGLLIPRIALGFWKDRWTKAGFNPKVIFANHYLTEFPVLAEIARDDWE